MASQATCRECDTATHCLAPVALWDIGTSYHSLITSAFLVSTKPHRQCCVALPAQIAEWPPSTTVMMTWILVVNLGRHLSSCFWTENPSVVLSVQALLSDGFTFSQVWGSSFGVLPSKQHSSVCEEPEVLFSDPNILNSHSFLLALALFVSLNLLTSPSCCIISLPSPSHYRADYE